MNQLDEIIYIRRKLKWLERSKLFDENYVSSIKESLQRTIAAIDRLPKTLMKTVIFAYYVEGLSIRSIANQLNFSGVYISKIKQRATKLMKQYL